MTFLVTIVVFFTMTGQITHQETERALVRDMAECQLWKHQKEFLPPPRPNTMEAYYCETVELGGDEV